MRFSSGTSRWCVAAFLAVTLACTAGWLVLGQRLTEQTGLRRQVWLANDFPGRPVINDVSQTATTDFLDDDPRLPREFFSARWQGYWYVPSSQSVTLHVDADDYADIWIDGELRFAKSTAAARGIRLGPVNTISLVVLSFVDGTYGGTVLSHCELLATATGQCEPVEPTGTQCDLVCRRARVQMARAAARFGNWHTIYTRMNRWSKNGVLDRVFEQLQRAQLVRIKLEAVSLDSTIVKVHPDGTGAQKKRSPGYRQVPRRMDHQDSSGCRGCSHSPHVRTLSRTSP